MTDLEYADRLDAIANSLTGFVGDQLALLTYADTLKKEAASIRDPQEPANPENAEADALAAAHLARGTSYQTDADRPKVALKDDPNAPADLPVIGEVPEEEPVAEPETVEPIDTTDRNEGAV